MTDSTKETSASPGKQQKMVAQDEQHPLAAVRGTQPTQEELEKAAQEFLTQERICNLVIVDLNHREIPLKTVQYEMVFELREFLNEHIYTCFFTNFYLEHNGDRLNEYSELSELDLKNNPRIFMRPEKYDDKSARLHIKRVIDILETPFVLNQTASSTKDISEEKVQSPRSRSASMDRVANEETKSVDEKTSQNVNEEQAEQDERLKQSYEEFLEVIKSHQNDDIQLPKEPEAKGNQALAILKHLFANPISTSNLNKLKHVACISSIEFSRFNPVSAPRKMAGDLFYLVVRTLENPNFEHVITCSINGFFKNESTESGQFNPKPTTRGSPCFSYTLVGCLHQLSPLFSKNLQIYLSSILKTEPYFLTPIQIHSESWIQKQEPKMKVSDMEEIGQTVVPLYGLDPKTMRDWNEEFQVTKTFPGEHFLQRIQKDRATHRIYNDFVEAATKGATAIIEGKLSPLNPNEALEHHVYVYNQIFYSFAIDLPTSFKDLTNAQNSPSFTQANHDINGLRLLQGLDVEGLYHLSTCLVQYRGHRVIAQSIIPGILNNSDLSSLAEYGTVDDRKSVVATEEFHSLMLKVADALKIKTNKVKDPATEKSLEIAGSIEVKGIKGSDKRSYAVDMQGLSPRDANYLGEEHHTCLVRHELISIYQRSQNMEYAAEHMKEFSKKLEAERKEDPKPEEGKGFTDEQKQEIAKKRQEENLKRITEAERLVKEAPKYSFNVNVFKSGVLLDMTEEELSVEEAQVKDLAKFLKEKAIKQLVGDFKSLEGVPVDSESLEDIFHKHGVNMRYLGEVITQILTPPKADENNSYANIQQKGDFKHLKNMLEKEIVLRSAKHVFNKVLKDECGETELYLAQIVSHLLNCLFAPSPFLHHLNSGQLKAEDESVQGLFAMFPETTVSSPRRNSQSHEKVPVKKEQVTEAPQKTENLSKKALKRLRQKKKQDSENNKEEEKKKEPTKDMSDILFNETNMTMGGQATTEFDEFKVEDLFNTPILSTGLNRLLTPPALAITPKELYDQIKEVASGRFGYQIPEQKKLNALSTPNQKTSLLRDLCLKVGVQLRYDEERTLVLGNNFKHLQAYYTSKLDQNQSNDKKAKKGAQKDKQVLISEQEIVSNYKYLPFQSNDISKLFGVVKHLKITNNDVRVLLQQAQQAYKENSLDRAFELYSQAINMLLQITGPMNREAASCISKIASIQFKLGDFLQAIELQTKAIVLQERLLGLDHPLTAYSYSTLAMYYHSCGFHSKGFDYMYRALHILQIVTGDYHPEIASIYLNLGLMYQEVDNPTAALDCYKLNLKQNIEMYGSSHIQTASAHQAIAQCNYRNQNFRQACESQEEAHELLKNILPEDSPYVSGSKQQLDLYFKLSIQQEKTKQSQSTRPIGVNNQAVDTDLLSAIQAAQQRSSAAYQQNARVEKKAGEVDVKLSKEQRDVAEKMQNLMEYQQAYSKLVQRMNDPKSRSFLDMLEMQRLKEAQAQAQKQFQESLAKAKQAEEAAAKKQDAKKQ